MNKQLCKKKKKKLPKHKERNKSLCHLKYTLHQLYHPQLSLLENSIQAGVTKNVKYSFPSA